MAHCCSTFLSSFPLRSPCMRVMAPGGSSREAERSETAGIPCHSPGWRPVQDVSDLLLGIRGCRLSPGSPRNAGSDGEARSHTVVSYAWAHDCTTSMCAGTQTSWPSSLVVLSRT